jgi:hypothetical protein
MNMHSRSEWGARAPHAVKRMGHSQGVHIHYNGPAVSAAVYAGDWDAVRSFLRGVQSFHMGPQRGWADIGYSFFVDRVGRIWEGRGWGVAGAHTNGFNSSSHAVYVVIGDGQEPSPAQVEAVRQVIAEHNRRYGVGYVRGHQQAPGNATSCPGGPLMALIRAGAFNVGTDAGSAAPTAPPANVDWAALRRLVAAQLLEPVRRLGTLRAGFSGQEVITWQRALNLLSNAKLAEDGSFGPATSDATVRFQRYFQLDADGIFGPKTRDLAVYLLALARDGKV